jgi:hypothetical protein
MRDQRVGLYREIGADEAKRLRAAAKLEIEATILRTPLNAS